MATKFIALALLSLLCIMGDKLRVSAETLEFSNTIQPSGTQCYLENI